ncbi:MAG TPA: hypothetical protein PLY23_08735, partial [Alphaproteobacteria bacterium]|nr:hypothetical protein [Alphaproteobacteria bacterium]HQS94721.1 hypothetical protein [Alphaproteobacteria bacterium]
MILYLKKILVFWICFSLFTQPLLAGNVLKRQADSSLDDQESSLRTHLISLQELYNDSADHHEELGDQESSLGLHLLLEETQMGPQEEENPSEMSQNRPSFSSLPFVFANYEPSLDSDELAPEKARLKAVEESWRNMVRWAYLSRLGHRILYFLFLKHSASPPETENLESSHSAPPIDAENSEPSSSETLSASILLPEPSELSDSSEEDPEPLIAEADARPESEDSAETSHSSPSHLWLHGRSFPLDEKDLRRVLAVNVAIEETEKVLIEGIHTLFAILVVSQVFYSIKNHTDFAKIFNIIFTSGDGNSIRDLYQIGSPIPHAQGLWGLVALPFAWGTFKGLKTYHYPEKEDLQHALETLEHLPVGFYHDNIRWFFPCLAVEHAFHELTGALLFEKELPSAEKRNILKSLDVFAQKHGGRSRMFAYHTFYNVADGVSIRNFSGLPENTQEELLQEKALALQCLMKGAHQPHKSLSNLIPSFYARYLLWTLGQCKGLAENVFFLGLRTAKTALTVLLFKTIIQGIIDILNCPQQQGQTWTGPAAWSSDYTYTCFQAYMNAFNNPIPGQPVETLTNLFSQFHLPSQIDMDLSGKGLNGTIISEILTAFIHSQPNVQIQVLNLSNNGIGDVSSSGTDALVETLKHLPLLQSLDLSNNAIGYTDSNGVVALAENLRYLRHLQSFDLSNNDIGLTDSNGVVELTENLRYLRQLQVLDLSYNQIGNTGSNGTVALAENLRYLTQLQSLDLSNNQIGNTGSNGTVALAESLRYLTQLQSLDLSNNFFGYTDFNGTIALAKNLPFFSQLRSLRISNNWFATSDESLLSILVSSLLSLKEISTLFIVAQENDVFPSNFSLTLQHNFNLPPSQTDIYLMQSADGMASYLSSLPSTLQHLDLSNRFTSLDSIMKVIGQYFANFSSLLSLDLSNNQIGLHDSNGFVALAENLRYLRHLQSLDLSNNQIGSQDSKGTVALAESLRYLTQLQVFDLSNNYIGMTDSNGTVELAGTLRYLTQLQVLDLSRNLIGKTDSNGAAELAKSLLSLTQLQSLDLSNNYIGSTDSNGTVALAESLLSLTQLQVLDLYNNGIGYQDSNGTVALAESLLSLTQLQSLDLSNNWIGTTDSNGISALLAALADLTQQSLTTLSLAGIQNIVWTQAANDLEVFTNRQLQSSCESQLCHGGSVPQPDIHSRTRSLVSSDQILSENTLPKEKPSQASKSSQKRPPQPEPEQPLDSMEEESFVTSSASSLQPPL